MRHVKLWRLETRPGSPSKLRPNNEGFAGNPKALSGRNCLLGGLGEQTFSCVASVSECESIVCTENGVICLLDDSEGSQKLTIVNYTSFGLTSIAVATDSGEVWLGGRGRRSVKMNLEEMRERTNLRSPSISSPVETVAPKTKSPSFISMAYLASHIVTIDSAKAIHVCPVEAFGDFSDEDKLRETLVPAHRDQVLGVRSLRMSNVYEADFFTWSCEGSVNFWDTQGRCRASRKVELEQMTLSDDDVINELRIFRFAEDLNAFVSGDRYGVLR